MKKVILANDHGGLSLVDKIKAHLASKGYEINHIGCYDEKAVDYPDIADKAVEEFKKGGYDFGVLICGTGIGISVRANKPVSFVLYLRIPLQPRQLRSITEQTLLLLEAE